MTTGSSAWLLPLLLPGVRHYAHDREVNRVKPGQRGPLRPWQQPVAPPKARGPKKQQAARRNEEIKAAEVMVVFPDGANKLMQLLDAVEAARGLGLDLVEIPGTRGPVVAKILDWDLLQKQKREAEEEARRQQRLKEKMAAPKEMQFTARIADHDLEVKLRKVNGFLEDGYKVLLVVKHRREEAQDAPAALDYVMERLRADRPGLEAGARNVAGRSVSLVAWWPKASKA